MLYYIQDKGKRGNTMDMVIRFCKIAIVISFEVSNMHGNKTFKYKKQEKISRIKMF